MTEPHLGGAYAQGDSSTIMIDCWGYLLVKHEIKSVLDVGCGYGHALQWFATNGLCQIKGVEGDPEAVEKSLVPGHVVLHDFTKGPAPIAQPFDLCWCAEFVEHVEQKYIPNYMKAFQLCRHLVMTHGEPGQAGHHHVTLKTTNWWRLILKEYGFEFDEDETALLRRTDRWKAPWGRRTLIVAHQL